MQLTRLSPSERSLSLVRCGLLVAVCAQLASCTTYNAARVRSIASAHDQKWAITTLNAVAEASSWSSDYYMEGNNQWFMKIRDIAADSSGLYGSHEWASPRSAGTLWRYGKPAFRYRINYHQIRAIKCLGRHETSEIQILYEKDNYMRSVWVNVAPSHLDAVIAAFVILTDGNVSPETQFSRTTTEFRR